MIRRRHLQVAVSAALVGALVLPAAGLARGPKEKTEICHYRPGQGVYKKTEAGGKALNSHLAHGDVFPDSETVDENCVLRSPVAVTGTMLLGLRLPEPIDYVNNDGDRVFDPETDTLITPSIELEDIAGGEDILNAMDELMSQLPELFGS